ncbi:MAG: BrnA antitoxin family protein [Rhodanobacteraceae bacterium]
MKTKHKSSGWIDPDDAPRWSARDFERAEYRIGDKSVTRAKAKAEVAKRTRGRPKSEAPKVPVKLRLDPDVAAALRATGDGWQTRVNDTLRANLKLAGQLP